MSTTRMNVQLNRVEGDLEIKVEIESGVVKDAWSSGTMFRGFENILAGRGALDGLVITPRICGICSITHLSAAARALDMVSGASVPDGARRIRNIALMTEHIQSDVRHYALMFAVDFLNPAYAGHSMYGEAARRYEPLKGSTAIETIRETKKVLEIIAILGGQWPHSSFMVPGGVVSLPGPSDLLLCGNLLANYRTWYEERVLGCSLERWAAVDSPSSLDAWLDESPSHRDSEVGFYIRFAREAGMDKYGAGHGNFLSYGSLELPDTTVVKGGTGGLLVQSGFAVGTEVLAFDHLRSRSMSTTRGLWTTKEAGIPPRARQNLMLPATRAGSIHGLRHPATTADRRRQARSRRWSWADIHCSRLSLRKTARTCSQGSLHGSSGRSRSSPQWSAGLPRRQRETTNSTFLREK